jgi:hypothetical protein
MADLIVVIGGTVSIFQLKDAGVGFIFPALSLALILKIWPPSFKSVELNLTGLLQVLKLDLSKLHSYCFIPTPLSSLPPVSFAENSNVTEFEDVLVPGAMILLSPAVAENIDVEGGSVSVVQLKEEGAEPLFPTLSSATTSNP